jgi:hypothetical protein
MLRRVADLVVYMIIIFPMNFLEAAAHVAFNAPLYTVAQSLALPMFVASVVFILAGRLYWLMFTQAAYGLAVTALKGWHASGYSSTDALLDKVVMTSVWLVILPVVLIYGFQRLVVERRGEV